MNPTEVTDLPRLPPRPRDANKGTFGTVLVVAGSRGMSGAAVLCASAALRGGAGLVRVAVPEGVLPIVAAANPCYTTVPLPEGGDGRLSMAALDALRDAMADCTVAVVGPGLGRGDDVGSAVRAAVAAAPVPLVLDADALFAFTGHLDLLAACPQPRIITPHPGEFARLAGLGIDAVQADRAEQAAGLAAKLGAVVVLKGAATVVTDGGRLSTNTTGNPGMATGGTGDVLAGLIGALAAQGLPPFEAAQLGVHLHGAAGDLAAANVGEVSLIASDLLDFLPEAFLDGGAA